MSAKLTIVALAWRETEHLRACFRSLGPLRALTRASTLIVLNSEANPETAHIAEQVADQVVAAPFVNFSVQRNRGLDLAGGEWVFFIDPDERCTPDLAQEIAQVIDKGEFAAYRVPRRNILFGREVRHTGWWPDYQIRLLRRALCRYDEEQQVHEVPIVEGQVGTLSAPLIHFNYRTWRQFAQKQQSYALLEARALFRDGRRAKPRSFIGQPLRELKRRMVDYQGYKDGLLGIALSLAIALYRLETYRQLYLLQRTNGKQ